MKNFTKQLIKCMLALMVFSGSIAIADSGDDETFRNITLEERLYQYDGFGAQWGFDVGSDGLWLVPEAPVGGNYSAPFKLRNAAADNTLVIGGNSKGTEDYIGIGTDTPVSTLDVRGEIAGRFSGSDTSNFHSMIALSADNAGGGNSDTGFSVENKEEGFAWAFRTYYPGEGFAATKLGTGGTEFEVDNTGTTTATTVVKMGGHIVFQNGHLVNSSSRSIKEHIAPLSTQKAFEAFRKLQPVTYEYKSNRGDTAVGFIAEDVPELVAMPTREAIDSSEIVAVLTKVVQEQDRRISAQDRTLAETRAEMKARDAEMEAMKAEIAELKAIK